MHCYVETNEAGSTSLSAFWTHKQRVNWTEKKVGNWTTQQIRTEDVCGCWKLEKNMTDDRLGVDPRHGDGLNLKSDEYGFLKRPLWKNTITLAGITFPENNELNVNCESIGSENPIKTVCSYFWVVPMLTQGRYNLYLAIPLHCFYRIFKKNSWQIHSDGWTWL